MSRKWGKMPPFYCLMTDNCGKILDYRLSRGRFIYQRNIEENTCYYMTRIRGNYISSSRIENVLDGKKINLFIDLFIPAIGGDLTNAKRVEVKETILVKTPIKDCDRHVALFRKATPDLEWF